VVGLLSKTVPDWTILIGVGVLVVALPLVLVTQSPSIACATATAVVADRNHPDNTLTVSKGSFIKVTVPPDVTPLSLPDVASSNYDVLQVDQTPCPFDSGDSQQPAFYFKAAREGSAQLVAEPLTSGGLFGFASTPVVWDVTVSPDDSALAIVLIEAAVAASAGVFVFYRRRSPA
jgi:hypothetical protein